MLLDSVYDPNALTEEDVEVFLAPLREPARARALSALYRHFLLPETARILSGAYRDARMKTPTLVLVGADDPIGPEFLHGIDEHVDDLAMEYVEGAGHFVADERPEVVIQRALEFFAKPYALPYELRGPVEPLGASPRLTGEHRTAKTEAARAHVPQPDR